MRYRILVEGSPPEKAPQLGPTWPPLMDFETGQRAENFSQKERRELVERALEDADPERAAEIGLESEEYVKVVRYEPGVDKGKLYDGVVEVPEELRHG